MARTWRERLGDKFIPDPDMPRGTIAFIGNDVVVRRVKGIDAVQAPKSPWAAPRLRKLIPVSDNPVDTPS